jgi:hypothetical protein
MAILVKNYKQGKASISQRFIRFKLISIKKHELETLQYMENKLVMTPWDTKVVVNLNVARKLP